MWLQLFVTKHVDWVGRARKGNVIAYVDFPVSLSEYGLRGTNSVMSEFSNFYLDVWNN